VGGGRHLDARCVYLEWITTIFVEMGCKISMVLYGLWKFGALWKSRAYLEFGLPGWPVGSLPN
jgi:hypothetical protein